MNRLSTLSNTLLSRRPQEAIKILGTRFDLPSLQNISSFHSSSQRMSAREQEAPALDDDVLLEEINGKGIITLNRPKALNALSLSMIRKIYPGLKHFEDSNKKMVIIKGKGEKAFCAGGDIRSVRDSALARTQLYQDFFKEEYQLNALIGTLHAPYIALIDGITMGGGVGLSVHGRFRVATERTLFAMPETGIGLFPDVGGTYVLPRLGGKLGIFLALTGARLKGSDVLTSGIATHLCHSSLLPILEQELISLESSKSQDIENVLLKFQKQTPDAKKPFSYDGVLDKINKNFSGKTMEEILDNLKADGSDWAKKQAELLSKMSPTSLKISLRALIEGANMDFIECLMMEYRLTQRCCEDHDFCEGVRAVLVDKDGTPIWSPPTLSQVTDEKVDSYFALLPPSRELSL